MVIKLRLSFSMVMVFVLMGSLAWANPPATEAANAPPGDAVMSADQVPFDPFDNPSGDSYGDKDLMLQAVADPIEGFNRTMFVFNDKLYFWLLKPVASGYRVVVPTPVRVSVKDFFFNLMGPVRFFNCLFQGKWRSAEGEFCRFMVNSTAGFLGLFNVVRDKPSFNPPVEDFGQTLGYYSIGNGIYIIWPLFGPSTLRDTVGSIGDWALNPVSFMQLVNADAGELTSGTTNVIAYGVRIVNDTSFRIGDYESLKNAALDPYEAFRNAYIQNRLSKIAQ
ncbi:VacJ family lipoprotein [uncultured Desulfosarcina sp.]|uniref:MlaA family lipoprotein n=1 Tax=uncultured Desulfosarcina sp. TaxID=218289 RepID=UPI0029C70837|nr:VacJ family lipoprotein [uncultured Desulfosarcina sp.]